MGSTVGRHLVSILIEGTNPQNNAIVGISHRFSEPCCTLVNFVPIQKPEWCLLPVGKGHLRMVTARLRVLGTPGLGRKLKSFTGEPVILAHGGRGMSSRPFLAI